MFHSQHSAAPMHAAARAVSGGPVYVSDAPGAHSFDILRQLVLPDGSILRCALPGRPTRDSLFADPLRDAATALKVWNANAATGVVGVFNLQGSSWSRARRRFAYHDTSPPALTATVRVTDVETYRQQAKAQQAAAQQAAAAAAAAAPAAAHAAQGERWEAGSASSSSGGDFEARANGNGAGAGNAGYESDVSSEGGRPAPPAAAAGAPATGQWALYVNTTKQLHLVSAEEGVEVTVAAGQAAVVTIAPVSRHFGVDFAPLGLTNMLNGGGAVTGVRVQAARPPAAAAAAVLDGASGGTEAYADLVSGELAGDGGGASAPPPLPRFLVGVRGRGTLLAVCGRAPAVCRVEGHRVAHRWEAGRLEVEVPQVGTHATQQLAVEFA
jgi:raffinose synthase